jgi:hypothetical protein
MGFFLAISSVMAFNPTVSMLIVLFGKGVCCVDVLTTLGDGTILVTENTDDAGTVTVFPLETTVIALKFGWLFDITSGFVGLEGMPWADLGCTIFPGEPTGNTMPELADETATVGVTCLWGGCWTFT